MLNRVVNTMLERIDLQSELLETRPLLPALPLSFAACINAHGSYTTEQFVLRLSPRNHQLIDKISTGIYASADLDGETLQAFSTYLHETVHWWQHIGSTSGFVLSLAYPALAHQNSQHLAEVLKRVGPKKPLKQWAENQALVSGDIQSPELQAANIAVNNAIDAEFYKLVAHTPPIIRRLSEDYHFESLGHCYWMAYGHAVAVLSATVDRNLEQLPDGRAWNENFQAVREAGTEGFVHKGPVGVAPLGIHALFEGQARMVQLQYLTFGVANPPDIAALRAKKQFDGIYGEAFMAFLKITNSSWPEHVDDPRVALFLLVVDLALNPTRGLPIDIEDFDNFIYDVDPGIRFLRLAQSVRDRPELLHAINDYSRDEYMTVATVLTEACGYDHPETALTIIAGWVTAMPEVARIMAERETFTFDPANIVLRVLLSHHIAFSIDKLETPEFFCWPGAWMAGPRVSERTQNLFLGHLSLFTDKADDEGIYPRNIPGKDPASLTTTLSLFYGNVVLYDLTRQWILSDGPFSYDYRWLTQTHSPEDSEQWAKSLFEHVYGVHPDAFEVLQSA